MTASWSSAERILCVRLDGLGDVLMTIPAMRALRERGGRLTLLTSSAGAALEGLIPEVDEVLTYAAPWMKSSVPALPGFGPQNGRKAPLSRF